MSRLGRRVKLSELLERTSRSARVDPVRDYPLLGVRLGGRGAFLRETVLGTATSATTLSQVASGDFIYSRLFAWRGAFAIVPPELDGSFVSGEFPTFRVDSERLHPRFLLWWFRTPAALFQVASNSAGSTAITRNRFKPEALLRLEIPLPTHDRQRNIVERLDQASKLIQAVGREMQATVDDGRRIVATAERSIWSDDAIEGAPTLEQVTTFLSRGRQSKQGDSQHRLIKTQHVQMGRLVPSTLTLAAEIAAKVKPEALIQTDDVLIACSAAGCLGRVAFYDLDEMTASTDTHVAIARPDQQKVLPQYLYRYLLSAQGQRELRSRERGDWGREKVGFRLTELNLRDLRQVPVPVPPIATQEAISSRLRSLDERVAELAALRERQTAQLESLLPALLHEAFTKA